jgi:hypothetical protein
MLVELREWKGLRTTFAPGIPEPVWMVEEFARALGNVPRAARCMGLPVSRLRAVLHYAQQNARRICYEREAALEAGFKPPPPPPKAIPSLVFPADKLLHSGCDLSETCAEPKVRHDDRRGRIRPNGSYGGMRPPISSRSPRPE